MRYLAQLALLLVCGLAHATPQSGSGGFYAYCNPSQGSAAQTNCQAAAAVQWLDTAQTVHNNLFLIINWRDLEPSEGVYNWSVPIGSGNRSIDTYIANAVSLGMNISIGITAGNLSPDWVMDAAAYATFTPYNPGNGNCFTGAGSQTGTVVTITGVTNGSITVGDFLTDSNQSAMAGDTRITSLGTGTGGTGTYNVNRSATTGAITVQKAFVVPLAWNTTLISKFNDAVNALAAHLAVVNGSIDARPYVKIIKIGGVNNSTEEFRNIAGTGGGTCNAANANQVWANAGWTPNKITTAFNSIVSNMVTTFTTAPYTNAMIFSVAVIFVNGMPAVDSSGNVYVPPPTRTDEVTRTVMQQLLSNAAYSSKHFAVQWNALSNNVVAPQPAMSYYQSLVSGYNNDTIAWQMNERGGGNGGSDCYYQTIPITFTAGLSAGATSGTLSDNNNQINGPNSVLFSDGENLKNQVVFSSASTAVTWATALKNNVTASATVTGFANCSYGANTGTAAGDYEQMVTNGVLLGAKFIEYFGVELPNIEASVNSLKAKSMGLPQ